jgi:hypothetical protein
MGEPRMQQPSRRTARWLLFVALALLALGFALRFALEPQRASRFLLDRVGASLGLEITARGAAEYRLRGTPRLVIRDVVAREPGATVPLLTADRMLLSLPWSTIRARGAVLAATRLELDRPVLQLAAMQHRLATRPPSQAPRMPELEDGLQVRDGSIRNAGAEADWHVDGIAIDLPHLAPQAPVHARVRGRFVSAGIRVPFDLALALVRAIALMDGSPTGMGVAGQLAVIGGEDWQLPAHLRLSGPLRFQVDDLQVAPARLGLAGSYRSDATTLPFALGAHGPLRYDDGKLVLSPARLLVHGRGNPAKDPLPDANVGGALAFGDALALDLDGRIAAWPAAWPTLPEPIGRPRGPLPVALDYRGPADLSGVVGLRASHGATRFDGRFRVRAIQDWLASDLAVPLPPLDGTVRTPLLEIAGARLEGVSIAVDDPAVDFPADQAVDGD